MAKTKERQRKSDRSRDPLPEQRGKKGPRPGGVRTDDLGAAITSTLEMAVMAIGRIVALERAARALDRTTKAERLRPARDAEATAIDGHLTNALRNAGANVVNPDPQGRTAAWAEIARIFEAKVAMNFRPSLRADERTTIVRGALRRVRLSGGRVTWVEDLLSVAAPGTPSIKELRRLSPAELAANYEGLKSEVMELAANLRNGFGERGRELLLDPKIDEVGRFFRALHPDWGTKKVDEYTAKLLGLGNESVVRKRRRKRANAS